VTANTIQPTMKIMITLSCMRIPSENQRPEAQN
jgi:hypothetical protein